MLTYSENTLAQTICFEIRKNNSTTGKRSGGGKTTFTEQFVLEIAAKNPK